MRSPEKIYESFMNPPAELPLSEVEFMCKFYVYEIRRSRKNHYVLSNKITKDIFTIATMHDKNPPVVEKTYIKKIRNRFDLRNTFYAELKKGKR